MSAVQFSHTDWENMLNEHDRGCDCRDVGVFVFAAYDPLGVRVAAKLGSACHAFDWDGGFEPGVAQEIADRLGVAYPGMEVLVWADPFMPVAARRGEAFEPVASSAGAP